MALNTLKNIEKIGEFKVLAERPKKENGEIDWNLFDEQRKESPIYIDHDVNMISFRLQNGPIKKVGVNGAQVDTLIEAAKLMLEGLNKTFPCCENQEVLHHLQESLHWLAHRKKDREKRDVEGKNEL